MDRVAAARASAQDEDGEEGHAASEKTGGHEHRVLRCDLDAAVGVEDHLYLVADGVAGPAPSRGSSAHTGWPSGPVYSTTSVA